MWWVLHTDDAKKNRPAPSALPVKSVLRQRHEVGRRVEGLTPLVE